MAPEVCGICGDEVPFSLTHHVLLHTGEDGVEDYFVCQDCFRSDLEPLFE